MKKIFWYDFGVNKNVAWALTCFVPLILFFLGFQNFIGVISLVGGSMIGIDGLLILIMYRKIFLTKYETHQHKLVKFLLPVLALIFIAGIVYEITYFIR